MPLKPKPLIANHAWTTPSGLTPDVTTVCDIEITHLLVDYTEQGCPLNVTLDLAGVPPTVFEDWIKAASKGKNPELWCITLMKKAGASFLYNNILDLNLASGQEYKKSLEVLRLRDPSNWSTNGSGTTIDDSEIEGTFL